MWREKYLDPTGKEKNGKSYIVRSIPVFTLHPTFLQLLHEEG
jgi:hypothetical protein